MSDTYAGEVVGNPPTEGKVWSASAGGTAGAALSAFICWVLGVAVWGAPSDSTSAVFAVASVPAPVVGIIALGLTFGGAYVSGWLAKHAPRPLLAALPLAEIEELNDAEPIPEDEDENHPDSRRVVDIG